MGAREKSRSAVRNGGFISFALLALLLGAGCRKEEISVYRVPKAPPAALANSQDAQNPALPFNFKVPSGWQQQTPTGMGLASFAIGDRKAEFSIMSFPGEGASQLNLVNIVRGNMGLAPLSPEELSKIVQTVDVGGEKGALIDLTRGTTTNHAPDSITVAVLPHGGATWFFKLSGISEVVAAQKPALLDLLKSISFNADAAAPASPHEQQSFTSVNAPISRDSLPPATAPDATSGRPSWSVPADWKEVSPGAMLLAKFVISANNGEADVTVSSFSGSVGGPLANVNRWRGQVGLEPIEESGLDKSVSQFDVPDGKAMLVDLNGKSAKTGKETRLVGVIWPRGSQTWFYKLMGDTAVTGAQKDAFLKFVQTVHYND